MGLVISIYIELTCGECSEAGAKAMNMITTGDG